MKKVWINKSESIEEAESFDRDYYAKMTSSERLETVQLLRESHAKLKRGIKNDGGKGLRRVLRIIKQE